MPYTLHYGPPRRGVKPQLDVHEANDPVGAVLLVHGGAFVRGSRNQPVMGRAASALNERGLTALSVDYRLLGRGGGFEKALEDVRRAMDFWRELETNRGHPSRLGVMGLSAGAALAAVAASEGGADAWVGVYGPYDFAKLPGAPRVHLPTRLLLKTRDPDKLHRRSPLSRCDADIPTLLFHGRRDRLVPVNHSRSLLQARRSRGLPVELVEVDAGHGYLRQKTSATARHTLETAAGFLSVEVGG